MTLMSNDLIPTTIDKVRAAQKDDVSKLTN